MPSSSGRHFRRSVGALWAAACVLAAGITAEPRPAAATDDPDADFSLKDTVQVGPFHMAPFFAIKDFGYDGNTRLDARRRSSDFMATFGPGARAVAPLGRLAALSVREQIDYALFAHESDLNHVNNSLRTKLHLYLRDFTLYADGEQVSTRDRPNSEIDYRIRTTATQGRFGFTWAPGTRGRTDLFLNRADFHYDPGRPDVPADFDPNQAAVIGRTIADNLERVETTFGLTSALRVRPRTSALLDLRAGSIDFDLVGPPQRDSTTHSAMAGLEFDPAGSLRGYLKLGAKHLAPEDPNVSGFSGFIADAALSARVAGRGELRAGYQRDTGFSIAGDNLFFVDDRKSLSYEHYMTGRLSVELGRQLEDVDYPVPIQRLSDASSACQSDPNKPACDPQRRRDIILGDRVTFRYRLGPSLRVGLSLGRWDRDSTFHSQDTRRDTITTLLEYTP